MSKKLYCELCMVEFGGSSGEAVEEFVNKHKIPREDIVQIVPNFTNKRGYLAVDGYNIFFYSELERKEVKRQEQQETDE
jgi:hypothetical protein